MSEPLDNRIARIEVELTRLRRGKLAELQSQIANIQKALDSAAGVPLESGSGVGKRRGRPQKSPKGWAASLQAEPAPSAARRSKKRGRKRGTYVPDEDAIVALRKAVAGSGKEGVSARQASQSSGIAYPRAIKLMGANFKKRGTGKWTRYSR